MFEALKLRKLAADVRGKDTPLALSSVLELGRVGNARAVELLVETLKRRDGVARSAARELGRLRAQGAIQPLVDVLDDPDVSQSAAEALTKIGGPALPIVITGARSPAARTRRCCAEILAQLGDGRAVGVLAGLVQGDPEYDVRVAAAAALGQLKDARGVWALVNVLKLRDEPTAERQEGLHRLRQAANVALRRIGDPLAQRDKNAPEVEAGEAELSGLHPVLEGDLGVLEVEELSGVLRELVQASDEITWAKLEKREPLLAPHFATYEMRQRTAEVVGRELHRRGGAQLLTLVLRSQLNNHATIRNWWEQLEG